jgi:hypothetical protein
MSTYTTITVSSRYGMAIYGTNIYGSYDLYAETFTKNGMRILYTKDAIPTWNKGKLNIQFTKIKEF